MTISGRPRPRSALRSRRRSGEAAGVGGAVASALEALRGIYQIDLELEVERFVVDPALARRVLPDPSPRSGVVVVEEGEQAWLGLYLDPRDRADPDTILEETSHLLCLAWHAAEGRPVSPLILELQGEIDRYAVARLEGRDAFRHFRDFVWDDWMDGATRRRYETAHRRGLRYCRRLARRYPRRADTPGLLAELRRFYRATCERKLRLAAA